MVSSSSPLLRLCAWVADRCCNLSRLEVQVGSHWVVVGSVCDKDWKVEQSTMVNIQIYSTYPLDTSGYRTYPLTIATFQERERSLIHLNVSRRLRFSMINCQGVSEAQGTGDHIWWHGRPSVQRWLRHRHIWGPWIFGATHLKLHQRCMVTDARTERSTLWIYCQVQLLIDKCVCIELYILYMWWFCIMYIVWIYIYTHTHIYIYTSPPSLELLFNSLIWRQKEGNLHLFHESRFGVSIMVLHRDRLSMGSTLHDCW